MKKAFSLLFLGSLLLAACFPADRSSSPPGITLSVQSTVPPTALPTPGSPGNMIRWQDLQVIMDQAEVTQDYTNEYGSTRVPPPGQKFLWVHVRLRNVGNVEIGLPPSEHFSVLYAAVELKPTYGHRKDHVDYTVLGPLIFPNQEVDAWLRFDVPDMAELNDLRFVFLPLSAEVGASPSSPSYPYAADKPAFVWKLGT